MATVKWAAGVLLLMSAIISSTWLTTVAQRQYKNNRLRVLVPYKLVETCKTNSVISAKEPEILIPKALGDLIVESLVTGSNTRIHHVDLFAYLYCRRQDDYQSDAVLGVIRDENGAVFGFDITEHNVLSASSNRTRNVVQIKNPQLKALISRGIYGLLNQEKESCSEAKAGN